LVVPAVLAVTVVASTVVVSSMFAACHTDRPVVDARVTDAPLDAPIV
jgi:hypothetical protein